jgi:hypothetical protein
MARKRRREPDIVSELQEDAGWSWFTNSHIRWKARGRPGFPKGRVGMGTIMLSAAIVIAAIAGLAALVIVVLKAIAAP